MARAGVEERILSGALDLMRSRGPQAVSIESVAAASGVAKTTIYRRYENRQSLLRAAVSSAAQGVQLPTGLGAQDTLRWVLRHGRDTIEEVVGRGTIAAVMSDVDPDFTEALLGLIRASTGPLREDLRERVTSGEMRADLDVELALSILLGVVLAETVRGRPTDDAWVEKALDLLWPSFAPRTD